MRHAHSLMVHIISFSKEKEIRRRVKGYAQEVRCGLYPQEGSGGSHADSKAEKQLVGFSSGIYTEPELSMFQ